MCLIYFFFRSPEHGALRGVGADSACGGVKAESRGEEERGVGSTADGSRGWGAGLGAWRSWAGRSLEPDWEQGLGGRAGGLEELGREEPGAGLAPPGGLVPKGWGAPTCLLPATPTRPR